MTVLSARSCKPCEGGVAPLDITSASKLLEEVEGWELNDTGTEIIRTFRFKNYYQTIAFINAVAWFTHAEDHHPLLEAGYNRCTLRYSTHAIGGLSGNDFICAAKANALITSE